MLRVTRWHAVWMTSIVCSIGSMLSGRASAQVEVNGWGELRGIRVDGELRRIRTTLCIASPRWKQYAATAHWRTRNQRYSREGNAIVSSGQFGFGLRNAQSLSFKQVLANAGQDSATIDLEATADADLDLEGVYLFVSVPGSEYGAGHGELSGGAGPISFATTRPSNDKHYANATATGARFVSARRSIDIILDGPAREITFQDDRADKGDPRLSLFVPVSTGPLKSGQKVQVRVTLKVSGEVDRGAATVKIDPSALGNRFAGLGGNFCWGTQSPVVPFYLDNLRIAWARVVMPLNHWHPDEHADPTTRPAEQQHEEIRESLRMATELRRRGIPMMISVWNAPQWAMVRRDPNSTGDGGPNRRLGRIDPSKWDTLEKSIGSYLLNFKRVVGAEPELFSFNEPNLGVNVRQTPEEHRDSIKRLGAHFASLGLRTKLALAEANEPNAVKYVDATMADADAVKYVGAVSYHSWNGGTDEQLRGWRDAANKLNVPLLIGEAGTDPDAHQYRPILDEPWYAVEEAAMYVRTLALSQPESILHWQLTPDYGPVQPGAGPQDPLRLTQRWWQFKQIDQWTPPNARVIAATSDHADITAAVLSPQGENSASVVHLVNTGAARPVTIIGLPAEAGEMRLVVTDATRQIRELDRVATSNGSARFTIPAQCFVTLVRPTP